jgi:hypothetical protein
MDSPVSRRTAGECKAIKSRGSNHSELTFVGILKSDPGASSKPVYEDSTHFLSLAKSR